jgi:hypothetical protein
LTYERYRVDRRKIKGKLVCTKNYWTKLSQGLLWIVNTSLFLHTSLPDCNVCRYVLLFGILRLRDCFTYNTLMNVSPDRYSQFDNRTRAGVCSVIERSLHINCLLFLQNEIINCAWIDQREGSFFAVPTHVSNTFFMGGWHVNSLVELYSTKI